MLIDLQEENLAAFLFIVVAKRNHEAHADHESGLDKALGELDAAFSEPHFASRQHLGISHGQRLFVFAHFGIARIGQALKKASGVSLISVSSCVCVPPSSVR